VEPLLVNPIGVIHTPFADKASAPRQPTVGQPAPGTIELFQGHNYHHGLEDLDSWRYIWVLFWFHLNSDWRPKVRPPRSNEKKGVFATRSPHRPNPIGLSVVELCSVEGHTLHVKGVDMVDGSPVLDLKPYVPYADNVPGNAGWLAPEGCEPAQPGDFAPPRLDGTDPGPQWQALWSEAATAQVDWLERRTGVSLRASIEQRLSLGHGHYYRRTWHDGEDLIMAYRSWRVRCSARDTTLTIKAIASGYSEHDLQHGPRSAVRWPEDAIEVHNDYVRWLTAAT
jgi:tRNA-Thr(GGU) m(6)t(6)A37 methyltransferase TsaA